MIGRRLFRGLICALCLTVLIPKLSLADDEDHAKKGPGSGPGAVGRAIDPETLRALETALANDKGLIETALKDLDAVRDNATTSTKADERDRFDDAVKHILNLRDSITVKNILGNILASDGMNFAPQKRARILAIVADQYKSGPAKAEVFKGNIARFFPNGDDQKKIETWLNQMRAAKDDITKADEPLRKFFQLAKDKRPPIDPSVVFGIVTAPENKFEPADLATRIGARAKAIDGGLPQSTPERIAAKGGKMNDVITGDEQAAQNFLHSLKTVRTGDSGTPGFDDALKQVLDATVAKGGKHEDARNFLTDLSKDRAKSDVRLEGAEAKRQDRIHDLSWDHYFLRAVEDAKGEIKTDSSIKNLVKDDGKRRTFLGLLRQAATNGADSEKFRSAIEQLFNFGKANGIPTDKLKEFLIATLRSSAVGPSGAGKREAIERLFNIFSTPGASDKLALKDVAGTVPITIPADPVSGTPERKGVPLSDPKADAVLGNLATIVGDLKSSNPTTAADAYRRLVDFAKRHDVPLSTLATALGNDRMKLTPQQKNTVRFAAIENDPGLPFVKEKVKSPTDGAALVKQMDDAKNASVTVGDLPVEKLNKGQLKAFFGKVDPILKQFQKGNFRTQGADLLRKAGNLSDDQKKALTALQQAREVRQEKLLGRVALGEGTPVEQVANAYVVEDYLSSHGAAALASSPDELKQVSAMLGSLQTLLPKDGPVDTKDEIKMMEANQFMAVAKGLFLRGKAKGVTPDTMLKMLLDESSSFHLDLTNLKKELLRRVAADLAGGGTTTPPPTTSVPPPSTDSSVPSLPVIDEKSEKAQALITQLMGLLTAKGLDKMVDNPTKKTEVLQRLVGLNNMDLTKPGDVKAFDEWTADLGKRAVAAGASHDALASFLELVLPANKAARARAILSGTTPPAITPPVTDPSVPPPTGGPVGAPPKVDPKDDNLKKLHGTLERYKLERMDQKVSASDPKKTETDPAKTERIVSLLYGLNESVITDANNTEGDRNFNAWVQELWDLAKSAPPPPGHTKEQLYEMLSNLLSGSPAKLARVRQILGIGGAAPPPAGPTTVPPAGPTVVPPAGPTTVPPSTIPPPPGDATVIEAEREPLRKLFADPRYGVSDLVKDKATGKESDADWATVRNAMMAILKSSTSEPVAENAARALLALAQSKGVDHRKLELMLTDRANDFSSGMSDPRIAMVHRIFGAGSSGGFSPAPPPAVSTVVPPPPGVTTIPAPPPSTTTIPAPPPAVTVVPPPSTGAPAPSVPAPSVGSSGSSLSVPGTGGGFPTRFWQSSFRAPNGRVLQPFDRVRDINGGWNYYFSSDGGNSGFLIADSGFVDSFGNPIRRIFQWRANGWGRSLGTSFNGSAHIGTVRFDPNTGSYVVRFSPTRVRNAGWGLNFPGMVSFGDGFDRADSGSDE